jgi:ATP-dependent DNA helicase RecG
MGLEQVKKPLKQKENIRLEFKKARNTLPSTIFESICAMLNRDGGDILLGVNDSGELIGVNIEQVDELVSQVVNLSNNQQKIDPPFILFPQVFDIDGITIIRIQVPVSSQIHKTENVVYDRSNDGDFKIIQPERIAALFNRKRTHFTELTPYNAIRFDDLNAELFPKLRNLIRSNNANHPWLALSDEQLIIKAGLLRRDPQTGHEAYTLAAVLLLGKMK